LESPKGEIIVITGPMFAGKTSFLIEKILAHQQLKIKVYKPKIDTRYGQNFISSHDKKQLIAENLALDQTPILTEVLDAIFIDEFQFFEEEIQSFIFEQQALGTTIYLSGLNLDFENKSFSGIETMIKVANQVFLLEGKCEKCNKPSTNTFRKSKQKEKIVIGSTEMYLSLCKKCYDEEN
jgi:thymidine kinase